MMNRVFGLFALVLFSCQNTTDAIVEPEVIAEASLVEISSIGENSYSRSTENIGKATFSQTGNVVTLRIELSGMTPNTSKAVHIHSGSVEVPGRHWNRGRFIAACSDESLGRPWNKLFAGDVGYVVIDGAGNGIFELSTDLWSINSGEADDVLDKIVIVHDLPMDFAEECNPFHTHGDEHTNPKIGGGVIVLVSSVEKVMQQDLSFMEQPAFTICK